MRRRAPVIERGLGVSVCSRGASHAHRPQVASGRHSQAKVAVPLGRLRMFNVYEVYGSLVLPFCRAGAVLTRVAVPA